MKQFERTEEHVRNIKSSPGKIIDEEKENNRSTENVFQGIQRRKKWKK